jgi:hypothetical protein
MTLKIGCDTSAGGSKPISQLREDLVNEWIGYLAPT